MPRIERIEVFVTDLPHRVRRTFSSGPYDTGPSGSQLGKPILVRLHAEGIVGQAQVRPIAPGHFVADTTAGALAAITDIYGPSLIGHRVSDVEAAHAMFDRRLAGNPAARAVLDLALHDAIGKALGVPVHALLGGACAPRIPLEWSVSLADDVGTMVAESRRAVEAFGIRVLCLKAADRRGWRQDVLHFEAVRRAVGDDIVIGVDPNAGWTYPDAAQALAALRPLGLGYLEQPLERRDLAGLAHLRGQAQGIPVMADESLFTLHDAFALARERAVDVFCIKLYKLGGLVPARKIAAVAEAAHVLLNSGGLAIQSQLEAAAAAHFHAAQPAHRMMGAAEFVFGLNTTAPDPLVGETSFVVRDGHVDVPTGPGLGVTIDEAALARHTLHRAEVKTA
ncbi:MAG: enolase C-terminal domain-like protein [Burkholderiales bacterium]